MRESHQQSSVLSRSQMDDDIVEIEGKRFFLSKSSSIIYLVTPSCNCQCHQSILNSNPTNEYLLFEQALRQTRQEQQNERSLDNNHLVQTLKRQHQELVTLYHRQIHINKTDREQQTMKINQHDSQIQTDLSTNQKSNNHLNGTHSTPNLKSSTTTTTGQRPFNSFLTPIRTTGPSLQQLIPCLKTTTTTNSHSSSIPATKHDFVDLTEEDEDNVNTASVKKISPIKQVSIMLLYLVMMNISFCSNQVLLLQQLELFVPIILLHPFKYDFVIDQLKNRFFSLSAFSPSSTT